MSMCEYMYMCMLITNLIDLATPYLEHSISYCCCNVAIAFEYTD
jgi:hypothetical protein